MVTKMKMNERGWNYDKGGVDYLGKGFTFTNVFFYGTNGLKKRRN